MEPFQEWSQHNWKTKRWCKEFAHGQIKAVPHLDTHWTLYSIKPGRQSGEGKNKEKDFSLSPAISLLGPEGINEDAVKRSKYHVTVCKAAPRP